MNQLRHVVFFLLLTLAWLVFAAALDSVVLITGVLIVLVTMTFFPSLYMEFVSLSAVRRVFGLAGFLLYILPALLIASLKLALLTTRPVSTCSRVVRYDYTINDRLGLLLLSISITLTPGTLVLDVDPTRNRLYIHNLDRCAVSVADTIESVRTIETRLLRVFP